MTGNVRVSSQALDAQAVAEVLALAARADQADGVAPLSEEFLLALRNPEADHLVTRAPDDSIVGVAIASGQGVEIAVDPDHRRRGIGRALLAASREAQPTAAYWAHGNLPAAQALAKAGGLEAARDLLKLGTAVGLNAAPGAEADGLEITPLSHADDAETFLDAWLTLNGIAFADHPEQGRWTWDDLTQRLREPWVDPALLWVAFRDGAPAASVWVKPESAETAEIYVLAVHPDQAGQGLGRRVLRHALGEIAARGFSAVELYVDGGNAAAVRLYERAGFAVQTRDVQYIATSRG